MIEQDPPWNDEKSWPNDRTMSTFISGQIVDEQDDFIQLDAFKKVLPWYVKYGSYTWYHSDIPIGQPIGWRIRKERPEIKVGIFDTASSGVPYHDRVWNIIKSYGMRGTSSIRGTLNDRKKVCIESNCFSKISDIGLWAVGWVGNTPANPEATVTEIGQAKTRSNWILDAMKSGDEQIKAITEEILMTGTAKDEITELVRLAQTLSSVEAEQGRMWAAIHKLEDGPEQGEGPASIAMSGKFEVTPEMKAAVTKGVSLEKMVEQCPHCKAYLSDLQKQGMTETQAMAKMREDLIHATFEKAYESFEDCVSDNQDKDDPESFCAWLKAEHEGAVKDNGHATPDGVVVDKKGDVPMADTPQGTPDAGKATPQAGGDGAAAPPEPTMKELLEKIESIQKSFEEFKGQVAVKGDVDAKSAETAKAMEELKKSVADQMKAFEEKLSIPTAKSRAKPVTGAGGMTDISKKPENVNDLLNMYAKK